MKKILFFLFLTMLLTPCFALELRHEEKCVLGVDELVNDNLVATCGEIKILGNVTGNLLAIGGDIKINGKIDGDLNTAGGDIKITGQVGGSVNSIGGDIELLGSVGGEFVGAGGEVIIFEQAIISGDAILFGGNVKQIGEISGNLEAIAGSIDINGTVGGNVKAKGEDIIIEESKIGGAVEKTIVSAKTIFLPTINFTTYLLKTTKLAKLSDIDFFSLFKTLSLIPLIPFGGNIVFMGIWKFVTYVIPLVIGALIVALFARESIEIYNHVFKKDLLKNFLVALIVFALLPVLLLFLVITIIGIPVAFILVLLLVLVFFFNTVYATLFVGGAVTERLGRGTKSLFWALVIGMISLWLIGFVPVIGWIIKVFIFTVGFGAICVAVFERPKISPPPMEKPKARAKPKIKAKEKEEFPVIRPRVEKETIDDFPVLGVDVGAKPKKRVKKPIKPKKEKKPMPKKGKK